MIALNEFGIDLIQALQRLSPALDFPMQFFTFLGKVEFFMLFLPLIYWVVNAQFGFRVFILFLTTNLVSLGFKQFFHQPRPYWIGDVQPLSGEPTYAFPSSHASVSMSIWGFLAYQVQRRWMWISAAALIFLISISRLYLGVHFPQDILFGWVIGLVVLYVYAKNSATISAKVNARTLGFKIGLGFILSLVFLGVGFLMNSLIASTPDPASYAQYSTEARSLTLYLTLSGAFCGSFIGYFLMKRFTPFQAPESYIKKAAAYMVGIIGLLIILYGLDMLFSLLAEDESTLGYVLRYIRYGLTTLWAMFGAPWAFLKLKLADYKE